MISATATADDTADHCVEAPACWLMAERVSEPDPGKQWKNDPAMFATLSDRHCWFILSFCLVWAARAFPIEIASSRPRSARASAPVEKVRIIPASMTGTAKEGSRAGI